MITLSKVLSIPTPASNKGSIYYDTTKEAMCVVDERGAQWFFAQQRCLLTADVSSAIITPADVSGMFFPLRPSGTPASFVGRYAFKFGLVYQTALATTGIILGLTTPSIPTIFGASVTIFGRAAAGAGTTWQGHITTSGGTVISDAVLVANTTYRAIVEGEIVTGTTGGNLQLQFATEVAGSGATLKQGCWGQLWLE